MQYNHSELVIRAGRWLENYSGRLGNYRCALVLTEYKCYANEIPDAIGFRSDKSILIECKATRQDFFADGNKTHRHGLKRLGNERFYLVPTGLVSKEEIPEGWGLLFAHDKKITIEIIPPYHPEPEIKVAEHTVLYSLLRRAKLRGLIPKLLTPLNEVESEIEL